MRLAGLSAATQELYLRAVSRLSKHPPVSDKLPPG
jgi:hypothetical protein